MKHGSQSWHLPKLNLLNKTNSTEKYKWMSVIFVLHEQCYGASLLGISNQQQHVSNFKSSVMQVIPQGEPNELTQTPRDSEQ